MSTNATGLWTKKDLAAYRHVWRASVAAAGQSGDEGSPCRNCHQRPATVAWCGPSGALAFTHQWYQWWCKPCALQEQIDYCRKAIDKLPLPELEAKLTAALAHADASPGYSP